MSHSPVKFACNMPLMRMDINLALMLNLKGDHILKADSPR